VRLLEAVTKINGLLDAEYEVLRKTCDDGDVVSFMSMSKYHNPGLHWLLVLDIKEQITKVVGGIWIAGHNDLCTGTR
jgi:hypothetical protein